MNITAEVVRIRPQQYPRRSRQDRTPTDVHQDQFTNVAGEIFIHVVL